MAESCSFSIHCTSPLLWDCGGTAAAARGGNCWRSQRKHFFCKKNMTGRLLENKTATGLYGNCRMEEDAQIELNKTSLPMLQASDQEISTHFDVVPTFDLFST